MDVFKQRENILKFLLYLPGATGKANEPIIGRTRLVKLVYLLGKENKFGKKIPKYYSFYPYMYGPFSSEILTDLNNLRQGGLIKQAEKVWSESYLDNNYKIKSYIYKLTKQGIDEIEALKLDKDDEKIREEIRGVKRRFNSMPLSNLITYVRSQ